MDIASKTLSCAAAALMLLGACNAETVVLRSGKTITGKVTGLTSAEVVLSRCGRQEKYARTEITSIDLSSNAPVEGCGTPGADFIELRPGTAIAARMFDHVDSSHEPPGQTFRAVVGTAVVQDARVVVAAGAKLVVRLVQVPGVTGRTETTLDLVGVQMGNDWAAVKGTGKVPVAEVEGGQDVMVKGFTVFVPGKSRLVFRFKDGARLVPDRT